MTLPDGLEPDSFLQALTLGTGAQSQTRQKGRVFVCSDGASYWLKRDGIHGLTSEIVAGRLASLIGAGPNVSIVNVSAAAIPPDGAGEEMKGYVFGSQEVPEAISDRDIIKFVAAGNAFPPGTWDADQRALVVAFQTWIGMNDAQCVLGPTDGRLWSIDHEDWDADRGANPPMSVVEFVVRGMTADVGKDRVFVTRAIDRVESVTDGDIDGAVQSIPRLANWDADEARLDAMCKALRDRRDALRGVMEPWAQ